MRRTIVTLDTKDGKYIPVFVVMEEFGPVFFENAVHDNWSLEGSLKKEPFEQTSVIS